MAMRRRTFRRRRTPTRKRRVFWIGDSLVGPTLLSDQPNVIVLAAADPADPIPGLDVLYPNEYVVERILIWYDWLITGIAAGGGVDSATLGWTMQVVNTQLDGNPITQEIVAPWRVTPSAEARNNAERSTLHTNRLHILADSNLNANTLVGTSGSSSAGPTGIIQGLGGGQHIGNPIDIRVKRKLSRDKVLLFTYGATFVATDLEVLFNFTYRVLLSAGRR